MQPTVLRAEKGSKTAPKAASVESGDSIIYSASAKEIEAAKKANIRKQNNILIPKNRPVVVDPKSDISKKDELKDNTIIDRDDGNNNNNNNNKKRMNKLPPKKKTTSKKVEKDTDDDEDYDNSHNNNNGGNHSLSDDLAEQERDEIKRRKKKNKLSQKPDHLTYQQWFTCDIFRTLPAKQQEKEIQYCLFQQQKMVNQYCQQNEDDNDNNNNNNNNGNNNHAGNQYLLFKEMIDTLKILKDEITTKPTNDYTTNRSLKTAEMNQRIKHELSMKKYVMQDQNGLQAMEVMTKITDRVTLYIYKKKKKKHTYKG